MKRNSRKERTRVKKAARAIERKKQVRKHDPNALNAIDTAFQASGEVLDAIEQRFGTFRETWVSERDRADLAIMQAALLAAHAAEFTAGVLFEAPEYLRPHLQHRLTQLVPKMRDEIWGKRRFLDLRVKELEKAPPVPPEHQPLQKRSMYVNLQDPELKIHESPEPAPENEEVLAIAVCPYCTKGSAEAGHPFTRFWLRRCMLGLIPPPASAIVPTDEHDSSVFSESTEPQVTNDQ